MRTAAVFVLLALFLVTPFSVLATYSNDSSSIDLDSSGASGGGAGSDSSDGSGGSNDGGSNPNDIVFPDDSGSGTTGGGDSGVTIPVDINGNGTGGSGTNGGAGNGGNGGTGANGSSAGGNGNGGSENGGTNPATQLIASLLNGQAIVYSNSDGGDGFSGSGDSDTITISGDSARAILAAHGISNINTPRPGVSDSFDISSLLRAKFLTKDDFSIVAASTVLQNQAIKKVILRLKTLTLTYESEGRLFGAFPMAFPITLTIEPKAGTVTDRVKVKFPWYSFFLQKFVSKLDLQRTIDAVITRVSTDDSGSMDAKTMLFIGVTEAIKARFDTVDGSVQKK